MAWRPISCQVIYQSEQVRYSHVGRRPRHAHAQKIPSDQTRPRDALWQHDAMADDWQRRVVRRADIPPPLVVDDWQVDGARIIKRSVQSRIVRLPGGGSVVNCGSFIFQQKQIHTYNTLCVCDDETDANSMHVIKLTLNRAATVSRPNRRQYGSSVCCPSVRPSVFRHFLFVLWGFQK